MAEAKKPTKKIVRRDPKPRAAIYNMGSFGILNQDKTKHYVWANMQDEENGKNKYYAMGYDTEVQREGGPKAARGRTVHEGEEITVSGHVLMSIDAEERARIEREGMDGRSGQQWGDLMEGRMIERKDGRDHFRGLVDRSYSNIPVADYKATD